MNEMFVQRELSEGVNIDIKLFTTRDKGVFTILVVQPISRDSESVGRRDIAYIMGLTYAANELWHPSGVIYDCRELIYHGGDTMSMLFSKFPHERVPEILSGALGLVEMPKVCVVSEQNRATFTSLCRCEANVNPDEVLFDSLETCAAELLKRLSKLHGLY